MKRAPSAAALELRRTVSQRIDEEHRRLGRSRVWLANFSGVSERHLRDVLSTRKGASLQWLRAVSAALECPVQWLLGSPVRAGGAGVNAPLARNLRIGIVRAAGGSVDRAATAAHRCPRHLYRLLQAPAAQCRLDTLADVAAALETAPWQLVHLEFARPRSDN